MLLLVIYCDCDFMPEELIVSKKLLEDLVYSSSLNRPLEFFCLLKKTNGVLDEFIYLPNEQSINSVSISSLVLSPYIDAGGSFHSHPDGSPFPSGQDKIFFKSFKINAILGEPFNINSINFFDSKGTQLKVKLV
jgi:hypothetical protein